MRIIVNYDNTIFLYTDGDENNQFSIGIEFGEILVSKLLDWEKKSHYNLTVSVTDGSHITLAKVGNS